MNIIVFWNVTSSILVDISEEPASPIIRSNDYPNGLTAAGFSETSVPKFVASLVIFTTEHTSDHGLCSCCSCSSLHTDALHCIRSALESVIYCVSVISTNEQEVTR